MSLETQVNNLATRMGSEAKSLRILLSNNAADLSALTTTAKDNLVAAINELNAAIAAAASSGGAAIDDANTAASTAWSSQKIDSEITAQAQTTKDEILGGAGAAYDTLQELATELQGNDADIATILAAQSKRVAVDTAQTFTAAEKTQGLANLGAIAAADIGDTAANFVAVFEAALV